MKELRELTKLPHADFLVNTEEMERGMTPASAEEVKTTRVPGRIHKLLQKHAKVRLRGACGRCVFVML